MMDFIYKIIKGLSKMKQDNLLLCYKHPIKQSVEKCSDCNFCFCSDCLLMVGEKETVMCKDCLEAKISSLENKIHLWIIYIGAISLSWILGLVIAIIFLNDFKSIYTKTSLEIISIWIACIIAYKWGKKEVQKQKDYKTSKPFHKI